MRSIQAIFRRPGYVALALCIAAAIFLFAMWFPNISLIKHILLSENISFIEKIIFLWNSLGYFTENFTWYSQVVVVFVSALSGINLSLFAFYFNTSRALGKSSGIGFFGTIIGMLGFGCVACNSVILSSIIGLSATAGFIGILPFGGIEIGIIGIALLSVSIVLISKKIGNPSICNINRS